VDCTLQLEVFIVPLYPPVSTPGQFDQAVCLVKPDKDCQILMYLRNKLFLISLLLTVVRDPHYVCLLVITTSREYCSTIFPAGIRLVTRWIYTGIPHSIHPEASLHLSAYFKYTTLGNNNKITVT